MGFRNPITTATDQQARDAAAAALAAANADLVNRTITGGTIQTATAGKRTKLTGPNGLQFLAGYVEETPGGIGSTAYGADPNILQGHELVVDAGASNAAGPVVRLQVAGAPAGGYQRATRLETDVLTATAPLQLAAGGQVRSWLGQTPDVFRNVPITVLGAGWPDAMYKDGVGVVHLEAMLKYTGASSFAPGGVLASLPGDLWPRGNVYVVTQAQNAPATVQVLTNGQVIYSGGPTLTNGQSVTVVVSYLGTTL